MELVFATHNQNKFKEVKLLMPNRIKLLSLNDIGCDKDIPETSSTIEGNAAQKANFVKDKYGYDCFADDTGLEVEALNGAPGVYSARYAGTQKNGTDNIEKLLTELKGIENRKARFKTAIALTIDFENVMFLGVCDGTITRKQRGDRGFGYDPIFLPENSTQTFAEMSISEKGDIGHRGKAMRQLISYLAI